MLPLTRSRNRARFFGIPFSPSTLFQGGTVAGAWYDPSDLSTMFTTSAGTTPVAMPGQGAAVPVGLMLDKSQGLVLGSELVTNGTFDTDSDWTKGTGWTIAGGVATHAAGTASNLDQANVTTPGKWYEFTVEATASGGTWALQLAGGTTTTVGSGLTTGNFSFIALAAASNTTLRVFAGSFTTLTIDNISVRELPGNHAIAFNNTTARPELRARVNLLEYSEQFDNGYWTKSNATVTSNVVAAPNGTTTADKLIENTATDNHFVRPSSFVAGTYTFSCFLRQAERTWAVLSSLDSTVKRTFFNLSLGVLGTVSAGHTATIVPAGNGWYQCTITVNVSAVSNFFYIGIANADNGNSYTGDGTSGIYIWGADLRPANIGANVPAYQRIADANTYDTSGFPLYLRFDGIDDSMYTPANLNLSGTDKVSVFAGVRKLSDAATAMLTEFSVNFNSNNGTFTFTAPENTGASGNYVSGSRGTAIAAVNQIAFSATTLAPVTSVLTATHDIPGDLSAIRLNGAASGTNGTGDKGSGNFGTYPLFIGARNNSSLWFNGHLYSLVVAGSAVSAGNISATEQWVAGKTGIQI